MAPVRATYYSGPAGPGGSTAMLVGCEDGVDRVVKAQGNPQGLRVLVNELVVARLAVLIEAPCPRGEIVFLPQRLISEAFTRNQHLPNGLEGLGFGSEWIDVQQYDPGKQLCADAINRSQLIDLIVLYLWVRNSDLKGEHLLYRTLASGEGEVLGFDHGHTFGPNPPNWDVNVVGLAEVDHPLNRCNIHEVVLTQDLDPSLAKLLNLEDEQVMNATRSIPGEWGASSVELEHLGQYLIKSREHVVRAVRALFPAQGAQT